jgi:hypothetical protein
MLQYLADEGNKLSCTQTGDENGVRIWHACPGSHGKKDTIILRALTTFYTPNPRYTVALQELTMEYSVKQYLLLTVHVSSDMNPTFVVQQNECGIYYTIMCTFQQLVGVHYKEDLHWSVFGTSVNLFTEAFRPTSIGRLCLMQTSWYYHIIYGTKLKTIPLYLQFHICGRELHSVDVFSTTTTFPHMFLKNKEVKKLVFNEVQIRELFNTGQRTSADHSEFQYSCSQNRRRHGIRTLDSKGSTREFRPDIKPYLPNEHTSSSTNLLFYYCFNSFLLT